MSVNAFKWKGLIKNLGKSGLDESRISYRVLLKFATK